MCQNNWCRSTRRTCSCPSTVRLQSWSTYVTNSATYRIDISLNDGIFVLTRNHDDLHLPDDPSHHPYKQPHSLKNIPVSLYNFVLFVTLISVSRNLVNNLMLVSSKTNRDICVVFRCNLSKHNDIFAIFLWKPFTRIYRFEIPQRFSQNRCIHRFWKNEFFPKSFLFPPWCKSYVASEWTSGRDRLVYIENIIHPYKVEKWSEKWKMDVWKNQGESWWEIWRIGWIDRRSITHYSCQQAADIAVHLTGARPFVPMLHPFASGTISSIFSPASALLPSCCPSHFPFRISTSRPQVTPVYRLCFVLTLKFRGEVERKQARSNGGINENLIPDNGCPQILLAVSWTASASRLRINYGAMFATLSR